MLKKYIKIAFRNIIKRKGFSFINIMGLGIGVASCLLIFLWVYNQLNYDKFHKNSDSLYAVSFNDGGLNSSPPVADYLKKNYPQILDTTRFKNWGRIRVKANDKDMMEDGAAFVDPSFLEMFSLNFYKGDPQSALKQPNSIVLSKSFAEKYFNHQNPIGETMTILGEDLKITGVIADYPTNSYIKFKFLLSFELFEKWGVNLKRWWLKWHRTYVQLHPKADINLVNKNISGLIKSFVKSESRTILLWPFSRLYLYHPEGGKKINIIIAFFIIALFVMLIACINFINLSTVQFSIRKKEVGLRKTVGAQKRQLVVQFFAEIFLVILLSWVVGLIILKLLLPEFNMLVGEFIPFISLFKGPVLAGIISLLFLSGLIAGSYPAIFVSSFKPVDIFKDREKTGNKGITLRKGLVVFQFILSIILIFGTMVLSTQLKHMQNSNLGFDKNNMVTFQTGNRIKSFSSFKNSLLEHKDIVNITGTSIPPYRLNMMAGEGQVHWEGQEQTKTKMVEITVDSDYAKTFGLKIVDGRFFSSKNKTDLTNAWVVNESAAKIMGMNSPIGKWLDVLKDRRKIIGVVKDFNFQSLRENITPMAMKMSSKYNWACVKIKQHNIPSTLKFIEKQWKQHSNNFPFEYNFLDEQLDRLYINEKRMGTMFKYFGILAIILSCMGMFGLASFLSQSRTKEIGIRKILGSTKSDLLILLSKDFIKWVIYAMLIAWPIAWFIMNRSLNIYAYKIQIGWEFFVLSGGLAIVIAVFSISYQIVKASYVNPIKSIRSQ